MKYFIIIILVAIGFLFMSNRTDNVLGGRCSPSGTCYACKNCSGCKHCAKEGGECSVCAIPKKAKPVVKKTPQPIKKAPIKKAK